MNSIWLLQLVILMSCTDTCLPLTISVNRNMQVLAYIAPEFLLHKFIVAVILKPNLRYFRENCCAFSFCLRF